MLKITKLQRNSEQVCGFHLAVLAAPPRLELIYVDLFLLSLCALFCFTVENGKCDLGYYLLLLSVYWKVIKKKQVMNIISSNNIDILGFLNL